MPTEKRAMEGIPKCPECRKYPLLEEMKQDPTTGEYWFFVNCRYCRRVTVGLNMQDAIDTWTEMCREG